MESGLTPELIQAVIAQKASQPSMFVSGWEDGVEEEENPDEIRLPENLVVEKSNLPKLREKAVQLLKVFIFMRIVLSQSHTSFSGRNGWGHCSGDRYTDRPRGVS